MPTPKPPHPAFEQGPLKWRSVWPGSHLGPGAYYAVNDLSGFFNNQTNISFKWLFYNNTNSDIFNKIASSIPMDLILENMESLAEPVYTNFIETNEDPEFLDISERFYRELFWNEVIYVSYDFFKQESQYILETDNGEKPPELDYFKDVGGFNLWVKITLNPYDKDNRFMHLETSITVEIPNWRKHLIMVQWNGKRMNNFVRWFRYSIEYIIGMKKINNFSNVLLKRIQITGTDELNDFMDDLSARLENVEAFYTSDESKRIDVIPKLFATGQDLRELHYSTFNMLDRRAYELGRVSNTNPKGERLTAGENYKDITSVANREKSILSCLKSFSNKVAKFWNKDLNFAVNGIPEKEMVEMENYKAPNPNSDGTGQGTSDTSMGLK